MEFTDFLGFEALCCFLSFCIMLGTSTSMDHYPDLKKQKSFWEILLYVNLFFVAFYAFLLIGKYVWCDVFGFSCGGPSTDYNSEPEVCYGRPC